MSSPLLIRRKDSGCSTSDLSGDSNPSPVSGSGSWSQHVPQVSKVVKEGLLYKRGTAGYFCCETIRNWRLRYFVLYEDSSLIGFKAKPESPYCKFGEPLNVFTVKDCKIMKTDRPKPFTFVIRGLQLAKVSDRTFYTDSELERQNWIDSIEKVAESLRDPHSSKYSEGAASRKRLIGENKVTLENFEFLKLLGEGGCGKVILSREKSSKRLYAVKILRKEFIIKRDKVDNTFRENRVLQTANHPFLISLKCSFQTRSSLCFVMEYVKGGDLFEHILNEKTFSENRTRFYGAEIVSAIGYLHQNGIIHRDVKLENLLLDKDGHIKLVDFGLCKEEITNGSTTTTFCGTREYLAPEVLQNTNYGQAVDWWGVGIVMYEMLNGRPPFYTRGTMSDSVADQILFEFIVFSEVEFPCSTSKVARDLLSGLLTKNPAVRIGSGPNDAKEVMDHAFFRSINWTDLVQKKITPPFKPQATSSDIDSVQIVLTPSPTETSKEKLSYIPGGDFEGFSYQNLSSV